MQPNSDSAAYSDFRDPPTRTWADGSFTPDHGTLHSLDGASTDVFRTEDVVEVLYHGEQGDRWDGNEAAVVRLADGRLAAWETWWGPTGTGFCDDAYGGDADVWFAAAESLPKLVLQALTDHGRELCGIPKEGLSDA